MTNWKKLTRDERIEILKDGIRRGLSAQQIANEVLGCTKGAVIGLSHKTGILLPSKRSGPQKEKPKPVWSETDLAGREAIIRPLLASGLSRSQIADRFINATPKAVKSFVERMRARDMFAPQAKQEAVRKSAPIAKPKPAKAAPEVAPKPALTGGVNIMDIFSDGCRYPLWEDAPRRPLRSPDDWNFCGEKVKPGSSYCSCHHDRVWMKPDRPQKYDRRFMAIGYAR